MKETLTRKTVDDSPSIKNQNFQGFFKIL